MKTLNNAYRQRRKFFMILPLLILPFVTMIFWALGGGQATPAQATALNTGLNLNLPSAHFFKKESQNKLNLYEDAKRDSLKFKEARENDPYFDIASLVPDSSTRLADGMEGILTSRSDKQALGKESIDVNELKVNQKLEELTRELSKPSQPANQKKSRNAQGHDKQFASDVDRLEAMMTMMQKGDGHDPEMAELSGVLDKILDIQDPNRVKERAKEVIRDQPFSKVNRLENSNVTLFTNQIDTALRPQHTQFLDVLNDDNRANSLDNSIRAVIHDTQEVVAGSTVKLRLIEDVTIDGKLVHEGQFMFGTCAINNERLTISISSIRQDGSMFDVKLSVYDLDGMEGVFIPGAITRDAAKQSSDQAIQSLQFMTLDPSIGAQAASAGLQAAKGLLSRKVKAIRVTLKAGYQVLLVDNDSTN
jgi:conjugative transposon TraM protein